LDWIGNADSDRRACACTRERQNTAMLTRKRVVLWRACWPSRLHQCITFRPGHDDRAGLGSSYFVCPTPASRQSADVETTTSCRSRHALCTCRLRERALPVCSIKSASSRRGQSQSANRAPETAGVALTPSVTIITRGNYNFHGRASTEFRKGSK